MAGRNDKTPAFVCIPKMMQRGRLRLNSQAPIMLSGERPLGVFHHLSKRRPAMAAAVDQRAHVEMRIEIDDADLTVRVHVSEEVAGSCFVAAAENHGNRMGLEGVGDDLP